MLSEEDLREYPVPSPDAEENLDAKVSRLSLQLKHIINILTTKGKLFPAAQAWSSALKTSLQTDTQT